MAKRKPDKKISALEPFFETIFVCNDKRLKPFLEVFVHEPENVAQQVLGTMLGIFEVTDLSEDSSYIVNYLISVIKKEYFSRPKRGAVESFEAALHKANLALSKLAEHGNIKWLGKFNALIAVIEKNNLHLSQAGNAFAFMLRSRSLTNISEGLASFESEPHPLKTFVNISSGRLEDKDKIIITTDSIFNIFSLDEIKKGALRFPGEKFIQFLKTALSNELEKAAVLVIDLQERAEAAIVSRVEKESNLNAFSSASFSKKSASAKSGEKIEGKNPVWTASAEEKTVGATEEKTGHIYIKETEKILPEQNRTSEFFSFLFEHAGNLQKKSAKIIKKIFRALAVRFKNICRPIPKPEVPTPLLIPPQENISPEEKTSFIEKLSVSARTYPEEKSFIEKLSALAGIVSKKMTALLLPNFSRLKKIGSGLNYQQRLYVLLIIIFIIVMPIFALKMQSYIQQKNTRPAPVAPAVVPLAEDKNVVRVDNLNNIYTGENILNTVNLGGKIFGISGSQIVDLAGQETFPIPQDFGNAKLAAGMDDLNLIFLLSDKNKLVSFSPVSKKFNYDNITIPDNIDLSAAGSYLTYLYLVDSKNSRIYRYPRAAGGFGEKVNWLKDTLDLSKASGMALSENIFIADGTRLIKLFKGKQQDFNLESSATPIAPDKVYAKSGSQNIYVLDKQNSRIVKLDLDGNIISQYYNYTIANANDFTIDETNNTAYISTSNNISSFTLN